VDHIPEGELAIHAFHPNTVAAERRAQIEAHVAVCDSCRTTADFFAVAEGDLKDSDVWEASAGSATRDALFAYAARVAGEDAEADDLLKPLFAHPAKAAWTNLAAQKRFLTGGVVRRLTAHAHSICEDIPLDALTFADAAISVAEALADDLYPANAVYELRGTAWKERANASMLLGDCVDAHASLTRAERAYNKLSFPSLGLAIVTLVRAAVFYQQQQFHEAAMLAAQAEQAFAHLGEDDRRMAALFLQASIAFETQDLSEAMTLFHRLIEYGEGMNHLVWIARGSYAIGDCEVGRGNLAAAGAHYQKALAILRKTGPSTDRVRTEWGIARVFLRSGKYEEAIRRLGQVVTEFEARSMVTDAALADLDRADALLALGQTKQVAELATRLFRVFTEAGMLTSALTAIAYIKEAAAAGTLTPAGVDAVRTFLRRSRRQPDLLFEPPPATSR
jgi:tetratricopeptide (TPR) repeat protein